MSKTKAPLWETEANKKSWFRHNMLWFVPAVILLTAIPIACCGGGFWMIWNTFSPPYHAALKIAQESPLMVDELGSPITGGQDINVKNYDLDEGNGSCNISFEITGPKSEGLVIAEMNCVDDVWTASNLRVQFRDGREIQIKGTKPAPSTDGAPAKPD